MESEAGLTDKDYADSYDFKFYRTKSSNSDGIYGYLKLAQSKDLSPQSWGKSNTKNNYIFEYVFYS